ncbi:MAG: protein phosphatase CheZ [Spongiibacteraceae bacterium]|jgi:chemotaxis protein CheZ|nr:protein phosphatase CheZ [Spongiibacteraceae bacterium]
MLGAENAGHRELLADLKDRAQALVEKLEGGDIPGATELIRHINEMRDRSIYQEVGKLTRALHQAIVDFEIDTAKAAGAEAEKMSKMANAQERLDYVINLTEKAADKTMDMVEEGIPVAARLGETARELHQDWQRLIRREMNPEEFRQLYHRIDAFLASASEDSAGLSNNFNEILMAQDFQDLSGQVIRKVITLVQEVEVQLVNLMRMASQVEDITGIVRPIDRTAPRGPDISPEGPQIKPETRVDVVSGQDDVDELLSSLGF